MIDYLLYFIGQTNLHDHLSTRGFGEASTFNGHIVPQTKSELCYSGGTKGEGNVDRLMARSTTEYMKNLRNPKNQRRASFTELRTEN